MKRFIQFFAFAALLSFTAINSDSGQTATVKKIDGYYFYWECEPTTRYEVLGEVGTGLQMSNSYEARRKYFLKNLKKDYPKADGLYFDPEKMNRFDAYAIQFVE